MSMEDLRNLSKEELFSLKGKIDEMKNKHTI